MNEGQGRTRIGKGHFLAAGGAILLVITILALYVASRDVVPQTSPDTEVVAPSNGQPVFLYEVAAPGSGAFRPRGAIIRDNKAYVADSEGRRVAVLDLEAGAEAQLIFIPIAPERPGDQLPGPPQPTGVAVLSDETLAVADSANGRIWKVGLDGSFLGELVDALERERSGLGSPVGLWATADEVYVTDVRDHALKVFSHSGRFLRRSGERGFRPGSFDYPNSVAAVTGGPVYVADSNNRRVQQLDAAGTPLSSLQSAGEGVDLGLPRGLAFDRFDRLHVVDTFGQAVYVFREGELQLVYGRGTGNEPALELPEGIAVSEERIVVSDAGNQRLLVFGY